MTTRTKTATFADFIIARKALATEAKRIAGEIASASRAVDGTILADVCILAASRAMYDYTERNAVFDADELTKNLKADLLGENASPSTVNQVVPLGVKAARLVSDGVRDFTIGYVNPKSRDGAAINAIGRAEMPKGFYRAVVSRQGTLTPYTKVRLGKAWQDVPVTGAAADLLVIPTREQLKAQYGGEYKGQILNHYGKVEGEPKDTDTDMVSKSLAKEVGEMSGDDKINLLTGTVKVLRDKPFWSNNKDNEIVQELLLEIAMLSAGLTDAEYSDDDGSEIPAASAN